MSARQPWPTRLFDQRVVVVSFGSSELRRHRKECGKRHLCSGHIGDGHLQVFPRDPGNARARDVPALVRSPRHRHSQSHRWQWDWCGYVRHLNEVLEYGVSDHLRHDLDWYKGGVLLRGGDESGERHLRCGDLGASENHLHMKEGSTGPSGKLSVGRE